MVRLRKEDIVRDRIPRSGVLILARAALPLLSGKIAAADRDLSSLDAKVKAALKYWHVPGAAVVIVEHNEVVYLKGFGSRELDKDGPVTPDTLFPLSSCTKAFTTLA